MKKDDFKSFIVSVFFPKRCRYCGELIRYSETLCEDCKSGLPIIEPPVCPACGMSKSDCDCKGRRHYYASVFGAFYYDGPIRKTVSRMKFNEKKFICKIMAEDMYRLFLREYSETDFDYICFVPFTESKKRKRDFNQAEVLANELSALTGIPVLDALECIYDTPPQHSLSRIYRKGNVFGIYEVKDKKAVKDKKILLVDDVKTTGASLDECAKMLRIYEAQSVNCITFAVASGNKNSVDS